MTVSDPGAGQQQGREPCDWPGPFGVRCGKSGPHESHRIAPSPTPPAQSCGCLPHWHAAYEECHEKSAPRPRRTPPARDQELGRDEAREAVARWLVAHYRDASVHCPLAVAQKEADELLNLPAVKALLR